MDTMERETRSDLPIFYRAPRVLETARHAAAGLKDGMGVGFAAATNSVPLGADEFFHVQAHYPIVFTGSSPAVPVAILGLGEAKNLFVDSGGKWRPDAYIPAYVRRYPFIFVKGRDDQLMLAVDEAADCYAADGGRAFFADGKPSKETQQALEFCAAFQAQAELAVNFGKALEDKGLLKEHRADLRKPDGTGTSLTGFRTIDESKFNELADEVFLEWRRRGWIALAHAHLMSMLRWPTIANLAEKALG